MATLEVVPGAGQDDPVRVALVGRGPGHLPARLPARSRTAAVRRPVDGGLTEYRRVDLLAPHEAPGSEPGQRHSSRPAGNAPSRVERGDSRSRSGVAPPRRRRALGRGRRMGLRLPAAPGPAARSLRARGRLRQPVRGERGLLPYMEPSHYWGFENNIELFIAGVADRAAARRRRQRARPLHRQRRLRPEGDAAPVRSRDRQRALPAAAAEQRRARDRQRRAQADAGRPLLRHVGPNPDPANFAPIVHTDGTTTYSDREPYHYPFDDARLARGCRRRPRRTVRGPNRIRAANRSMVITRSQS